MNIENWIDRGISIAIIVVLAIVVRYLVHRLIAKSIASATKREAERIQDLDARAAIIIAHQGSVDSKRQTQRATTLGSVLGSVLDGVLFIVCTLMILGELGINVAPAIASAGIGGLAIGFGAQSLIKDVITGTFLVLEDQFGVGDFVKIGDLEGTVQAVHFRTTRLQDSSGSIWYVRNGEIVRVGNRTQGWSTATIGIPIALTEDPLKVVDVLSKVAESLEADEQWHDQMLEPPTVLGLSRINPTDMVFTILLKCPPNQQWEVERETRARAVLALQQAGIKTPDPLTYPPIRDA